MSSNNFVNIFCTFGVKEATEWSVKCCYLGWEGIYFYESKGHLHRTEITTYTDDERHYSLRNLINNRIPEQIREKYSFVVRMDVSNSKLGDLSREHLVDFENLECFTAAHNHLRSLPSNLFVDKPKLKSVSFFNNQLEFLSSQLLEPIIENGLVKVDFRSNEKIDAIHSSDTLGSISLQELIEMIDNQCEASPDDMVGILEATTIQNAHYFFPSRQQPDLTVAVESSIKFRVFKNVLQRESPVFAGMVRDDVYEEERLGEIRIPDFSACAVENFLGFLHTGFLPDEENAMELFALACKYDVPKLRLLSQQTILKYLCTDNAFEIFNLAHLYSCNKLKSEAYRTIQILLRRKIRRKKLAKMNLSMNVDPASLVKMIKIAERWSFISFVMKDRLTQVISRLIAEFLSSELF